jgi:hypothetical protein
MNEHLRKAIQSIDHWESMSAGQLFAALTTLRHPFEDRADWTWKGIALVWCPDRNARFGREGCRLLQDVLVASGDQWLVTQLGAGMPLWDSEVQSILRGLDAAGHVPGAAYVADAVVRMISTLELHGIECDEPEVASELAAMRLDALKQYKNDQADDRRQVYRERITVWNGDPATEPKL